MKRSQVPYQTLYRIRLSLPSPELHNYETDHGKLFKFLRTSKRIMTFSTDWGCWQDLLPRKIYITCLNHDDTMKVANWVEKWAKKYDIEFTFVGSDLK